MSLLSLRGAAEPPCGWQDYGSPQPGLPLRL